jgi:hypothetical protein
VLKSKRGKEAGQAGEEEVSEKGRGGKVRGREEWEWLKWKERVVRNGRGAMGREKCHWETLTPQLYTSSSEAWLLRDVNKQTTHATIFSNQ